MKSLLSAAAFFIAILSVQAQETVYRSELPSKVRSFLTYFKSPFHHAVKASDDLSTTYDIVLNNKTEIQFGENGLWTLIDGKGNPVPFKFLDKPIQEYLKTNSKDLVVTKIERSNSECRLAFSNGQKCHFDANGTLLAANQ
ncbi:PepSY-like domain-containing protein [Flavobacterium hauense]